MSLIERFINRIRRRRYRPSKYTGPPIVIETQWGPVSEAARHQAALNMRKDPILRAKVEEMLARECGTDETAMWAGAAEARRRYPEAYEEDD